MIKHVVGIGIAVCTLVTGVVLIMAPFALETGSGGTGVTAATQAVAAGGAVIAILAVASLGIHLASVIDDARREGGHARWSPAEQPDAPAVPRSAPREAQRQGRAWVSERAGFPEPRPMDDEHAGGAEAPLPGPTQGDAGGPRLRERHQVVTGGP